MPYMRVIPPGLDFTMLKVSIRLLVSKPAMQSFVEHEHLRPCGVHGAGISLPLPACTCKPPTPWMLDLSRHRCWP